MIFERSNVTVDSPVIDWYSKLMWSLRLHSILLLTTFLACSGQVVEPPRKLPEAAVPVVFKEPVCPATPDFAEQLVEAAERIRPSVVAVSSGTFPGHGAQSIGVGSSPLSLFLRGLPTARPADPRGIGSGVIVDSAGTILTNQHIVSGVQRVSVQLIDGRQREAKVLGSDVRTDLALVRIDPKGLDLQPAQLEGSVRLRVGDWVLACGNSFGRHQVVHAGIISSLGRGSAGIAEPEDFIQTDAAILPENSGGPLIDRTGRVVGINSAFGSEAKGKAGGGFAIPIDMALSVVAQLREAGKVVRGDIGVYVASLGDELAQSFGYRGEGGVLIQDVLADSPAARAGLQPGDILVERDGKTIENPSAFRNAIATTPPRQTASLRVFRDGKLRTVDVEIGEMQAVAPEETVVESPDQLLWGLELANITPEVQQRLSLKSLKGALILSVSPSSPSDEAGLRAGDVITSIGDAEILDADHAHRVLLTARGSVRMRILHDGRGMFAMVRGATP